MKIQQFTVKVIGYDPMKVKNKMHFSQCWKSLNLVLVNQTLYFENCIQIVRLTDRELSPQIFKFAGPGLKGTCKLCTRYGHNPGCFFC